MIRKLLLFTAAVLIGGVSFVLVQTGSRRSDSEIADQPSDITNELDPTSLPTAHLRPDVSGDASMASLHVPDGETFTFDPRSDTTLKITEGSTLIEGTLEMKPTGPDIEHRLIFEGVDESRFEGGGMGPTGPDDPLLTSDRGLWVMDDGFLDVRGAPKTAWTYGPPKAHGWRSTDEILVAPTAPGDDEFRPYTGQVLHEISTPWGETFSPEVINLSRNVWIEGTPKGRAHVFMRSSRPQSIRFAGVRYLGPRKSSTWAAGESIVGRWPLHFHHAGDGSRQSIVEGLVATEVGSHAFVAHGSHGVTFRDNIAFDVQNSPYWWDLPSSNDPHPESNDISYEHNFAGLVRIGDRDLNGKATAFFMVGGRGNTARGNVATVIEGGPDRNGFRWDNVPDSSNWTFADNLAHNLSRGVHMWSNHRATADIRGFSSYSTDDQALSLGAYNNDYQWEDVSIWGDSIALKATTVATPTEKHSGILGGNIGGGEYAVEIEEHVPSSLDRGLRPSIVRDLHIWDVMRAPVHIDEGGGNDGFYQFVDVTVHENGVARELEPRDFEVIHMHPSSRIWVQRRNETAYRINSNGSASSIPAFAGR